MKEKSNPAFCPYCVKKYGAELLGFRKAALIPISMGKEEIAQCVSCRRFFKNGEEIIFKKKGFNPSRREDA